MHFNRTNIIKAVEYMQKSKDRINLKSSQTQFDWEIQSKGCLRIVSFMLMFYAVVEGRRRFHQMMMMMRLSRQNEVSADCGVGILLQTFNRKL